MILSGYLDFLEPEIFQKAFEEKLRRTKRPKDRARLQDRRPVIEEHCSSLQEYVDRDEALPEDVFQSVHFAAALCREYVSRDAVQMRSLISGRAFWGIPTTCSEGTVVWDKSDQDLMRGKFHPLEMRQQGKSRKR